MSAYFTFIPLIRNTLARADAVNAAFAATSAGFDKLPTELQLKRATVTLGTEIGGVANAYAVTMPYAPTAYTLGMSVLFQPAAENTLAPTLNVNALGVKQIRRFDGSVMEAGEIPANGMVEVRYDGTYFRMVNGQPVAKPLAYTAANKAGDTFTGPVTVVGTVTAPLFVGPFTGFTGQVAIAQGGTGQTSANAALNALLPSQSGQNGKILSTNGANTSWIAPGSVSSITAGTGLTGGTISTSGTIGLGNTAVAAGSYGAAGSVATFTVDAQGRLSAAASVAIAITGAQVSGNIAGSAANVSGIVGPANGGTGQTSLAAAINALLPAQAGNGGKYITTDGTNPSWGSPAGAGTVTSVSAGTGLTGGPITGSGALSLANTAVVAGNYGGTGNVATFTVDQQGRITAAANVGINVVGILGYNPANKAGENFTGDIVMTAGRIIYFYNSAGNNFATVTNTGATGAGNANLQFNISGLGPVLNLRSDGKVEAPSGFIGSLTGNATTAGTISGSINGSQVSGNISGLAAGLSGTLPVVTGGTGATTAAQARTNLGISASGSDTAYAYRSNNLSDLGNVASARTNLGIGSMATRAATISTAAPSGGADGDVWFRY